MQTQDSRGRNSGESLAREERGRNLCRDVPFKDPPPARADHDSTGVLRRGLQYGGRIAERLVRRGVPTREPDPGVAHVHRHPEGRRFVVRPRSNHVHGVRRRSTVSRHGGDWEALTFDSTTSATRRGLVMATPSHAPSSKGPLIATGRRRHDGRERPHCDDGVGVVKAPDTGEIDSRVDAVVQLPPREKPDVAGHRRPARWRCNGEVGHVPRRKRGVHGHKRCPRVGRRKQGRRAVVVVHSSLGRRRRICQLLLGRQGLPKPEVSLHPARDDATGRVVPGLAIVGRERERQAAAGRHDRLGAVKGVDSDAVRVGLIGRVRRVPGRVGKGCTAVARHPDPRVQTAPLRCAVAALVLIARSHPHRVGGGLAGVDRECRGNIEDAAVRPAVGCLKLRRRPRRVAVVVPPAADVGGAGEHVARRGCPHHVHDHLFVPRLHAGKREGGGQGRGRRRVDAKVVGGPEGRCGGARVKRERAPGVEARHERVPRPPRHTRCH
eukprot:m.21665 g.21665  ORF g.21665 m.21665 type:complete len:494 (+) comp10512_c0_seq1:203-1684(+)